MSKPNFCSRGRGWGAVRPQHPDLEKGDCITQADTLRNLRVYMYQLKKRADSGGQPGLVFVLGLAFNCLGSTRTHFLHPFVKKQKPRKTMMTRKQQWLICREDTQCKVPQPPLPSPLPPTASPSAGSTNRTWLVDNVRSCNFLIL